MSSNFHFSARGNQQAFASINVGLWEQSDTRSRRSEVGTFQPAKFKHLKADAKLMKAI